MQLALVSVMREMELIEVANCIIYLHTCISIV